MYDASYFQGRSVLVTGASGFIGSHLCRRLAELGATVHGVSRTARSDAAVSRWWQARLELENETTGLVEAISPDIIFHLASFVSGKREVEFVLPALHSNLLSTVNLLVAAQRAGCSRVVLTGSLEETEGEASAVIPVSPYAAAKSAASAYARMFHALYDAPVVTARLFMVYGPAQQDHAKLVPYVTLSMLNGEVPQLMSGTREIDWVYVDDVVDAYLALASKPGIEGRTVDVGSGALTSVRNVVECLGDIIAPAKRPQFGGVADRPLERVRVADVKTAYEISGWQPKTTLQHGLEQTVEWYRGQLRRPG